MKHSLTFLVVLLLAHAARELPEGPALTVEGWTAPQEYSRGCTARNRP